VQAAKGVSRFEWQVLNLLHEAGEASRERLFETMRTFVDASGLDTILNPGELLLEEFLKPMIISQYKNEKSL
jgi:hypothetical protein